MSSAIDGIISGFDTSSMIEAILTYESEKITLVEEQLTEATNKLTTWQSIEALLLSVQTDAALLSDTSLWYAKTATSSNEDIISVTASDSAASGTYTLSVEQLASNHQIASVGMASTSETFGSGSIEIQVGDGDIVEISVDTTNNTLSSLKDAINEADAGVTATILNDGTESNPYRLVLTSNETGEAGEISIEMNLSGENIPEFTTGFDEAETLSWSDEATSSPTLSSSATYTGNENKTYTFTVLGDGEQTVGDGDIEIEWSDGTNSGVITVSASDTDIELTGDGADGLVLSFDEGTLVAGDTFQIQSFSPTVQKAQNAEVRLGSSTGGGSPITFSSDSNTITDLIDGVTLDLNTLSEGEEVEITVAEDRSQIKSQIESFVERYNEYQEFVDEQFTYDEDEESAGILMSDTTLLLMHDSLRTTILSTLDGASDDLNRLSLVGITFETDGSLSFDSSVFDDAVEDDFNEVMNLFKSNGATNTNKIEFVSSTSLTEITTTGYEVEITQAAKQASYTTVSIENPATTPLILNDTNNTFQVVLNNITSGEIQLEEKTYYSGEDLAEEVEEKINADTSVSGIGVTVEWVDTGNTGYMVIKTDTYGDTSTISFDIEPDNSAHTVLGFDGGSAEDGQDVEGTINGESATGTGQYLIGDTGNENTSGLKLLVTMTEDDLDIHNSEGLVYFNKGFAEVLEDKIEGFTDEYEGTIQAKKSALEENIEDYNERIEFLEEQLEFRREALYDQFTEMEETLAELETISETIDAIISSLDSSGVYTGSSSDD